LIQKKKIDLKNINKIVNKMSEECIICYNEWTEEDILHWNGSKIFICEVCSKFTCGECMDKIAEQEKKDKGLTHCFYQCNRNIICSYCRSTNYKYHFDENVIYWIKFAGINIGELFPYDYKNEKPKPIESWCLWAWSKIDIIPKKDLEFIYNKYHLDYIFSKNL